MSLDAFRVREVEDKMRKAAAELDFEQAIVLRDQSRAMRAELVAANPPAVKVINLLTRDEHVPDEEDADNEDIVETTSDINVANPDVIAFLETLLDQAEEGNIQAIAAIVAYDNKVSDVDCVWTDSVLDHVRLFVGGAHTLSTDLLAVEQDMFDMEDFPEDNEA